MPVPSSISDLSTTPALNSPPGSESPSSIDDYLRTLSAFIRQINDLKADASAVVKLAGNQTVAGVKTFSASPVVPDATAPLQAVPLQQLNAAIASVPSTVAAYAPPFYNVRAVVELAPSSAAFTDLSGGVLQSSRGGWGNPSQASITVQAPGFVRVTATGIFCFDAAKTSTAIVRVKKNATYLNPEFEIMNGSGSQAVNLIIPVEIGDVIRVAVKAVGTVTSFGCQSISYEYFGPAA